MIFLFILFAVLFLAAVVWFLDRLARYGGDMPSDQEVKELERKLMRRALK